jgi:hypothetical protein
MFDEAALERAAKQLAAQKHITFDAALVIMKDTAKRYEVHKIFTEMLMREPAGSNIQLTVNNFIEN